MHKISATKKCVLDEVTSVCFLIDDRQKRDNYVNTCNRLYEYIKSNNHIIFDKKMQDNIILLCSAYGNIKILKYFIETCKMDVKHPKDWNNNNCLIFACQKNTNLDVIKYLIETCKMDINHTNGDKENCLICACWENTNLDIIKYLIERCKMDVNYTSNGNKNCLMWACRDNSNLDIIKYLIESCKMDIKNKGNCPDCLKLACSRNTNLLIIKYLIETCKINVNHTDSNNRTCLTWACESNTNLEIIKYLIETCKMDVNYNIYYLANACACNTNLDIIKYLIETCEHKINEFLSFEGIAFEKYEKIILTLDTQTRISEMILTGLNHYDLESKMMGIIGKINPLLLTPIMRDMVGLKNPYHSDYKFVTTYVDKLKRPITVPEFTIPIKTEKKDLDFTNVELLFIHNEIEYYGNKRLVYNTFEIFKNITDLFDTSDPIILQGFLPKHIINAIVGACYTRSFNIDIVKRHYFTEFLKFVDRYPTSIVSIGTIEDQIIKYMIKNNINHTDYIKGVCDRYKLRYLYLHVHNQILLTQDMKKLYQTDYKLVTIDADKLERLATSPKFTKSIKTEKKDLDFTNADLLFIHNEIGYYGDKNTVHDTFEIFKNITNLFDISEPIILEGNLPKHIINAIIGACYTGSFNMDIVDRKYFMEFIKFVDKYPTLNVSIVTIKDQMIEYMVKNNIKIDDYIKGLCDRYNLKNLYNKISSIHFAKKIFSIEDKKVNNSTKVQFIKSL